MEIDVESKEIISSLEKKELDLCDLTTNFKDVKILDHTTISHTIIAFGKILKKDVVIKISFDTIDTKKRDTSLELERLIYKYIIKKLVDEKCTPHLVYPYGEARCVDFWNTLQKNKNLKQIILNKIDSQLDNIPENPDKFLDRRVKVLDDFIKTETKIIPNLDIEINVIGIIESSKINIDLKIKSLIQKKSMHISSDNQLIIKKEVYLFLEEFIKNVSDAQQKLWSSLFDKNLIQYDNTNKQRSLNIFSFLLNYVFKSKSIYFNKPSVKLDSPDPIDLKKLFDRRLTKKEDKFILNKYELYMITIHKTIYNSISLMKTIQLVELFEDELLKSYDYVYYFMLRIIDKLSNNDNTAWGPNSPINLYHHIMIRIFKKYIYEKIDYEYSLYNYDISKANLLILEKIDGHTLRDRIYMETEVNDVKRIIFQVLYTLHVFNVNGIRHNDLHFNNIFIIYNKNPEKLSYYMNTIKQGFLFESTHIVKIYDFDLSYVERIAMKSKVVDEEHCMRLGLCNEPNPKFDTFKFLKELSMVAFEMRGLQKTVQEFIFDFIFECFPGGHNNILLKKDDTHLFDPDNPGNYIPPDDLMRSTEQILEFDTFKEFRTESKNEKDYTYTDKIIKLF